MFGFASSARLSGFLGLQARRVSASVSRVLPGSSSRASVPALLLLSSRSRSSSCSVRFSQQCAQPAAGLAPTSRSSGTAEKPADSWIVTGDGKASSSEMSCNPAARSRTRESLLRIFGEQQECESGIPEFPHWSAICLQHSCSAVERSARSRQAIAGTDNVSPTHSQATNLRSQRIVKDYSVSLSDCNLALRNIHSLTPAGGAGR